MNYSLFIVIIGSLILSTTILTTSAFVTALQLTVEGDITDSLDENQIKNELPTVSGLGGYQRSTGTIVPASEWKGIHVPLFLSSLLGDVNYNVDFVAIDDYSISITRDEVEGGIRAFDGSNTTLPAKVIPVLAYEENDVPVSNEDGPLRLVFIGENNESILTVSPRWVKQIVKLIVTIITEDTSSVINTGTSTTIPISNNSTSTSSEETDTFTTASISIKFSFLLLGISTIIITGIRRKKYQK
ncbi:MAG: hypothetical protein ACW98I_02900 [Candidatus Hodarchaeales archaeon]